MVIAQRRSNAALQSDQSVLDEFEVGTAFGVLVCWCFRCVGVLNQGFGSCWVTCVSGCWLRRRSRPAAGTAGQGRPPAKGPTPERRTCACRVNK